MNKIDKHKTEPFGNLEFLARQVVEGFITGLHKSPFHGFSVEFAEHRLYNTGESTRHIDWKLFARTDKLFIKRYEEETNLRCQIIIDTSSSMFFPETPEKGFYNKIGFSIHAAAALMELLKRQRDACGLSLFSEQIELHTPSKSSITHQKFLYSELEKHLQLFSAGNPHTTRAAQCLHRIAEAVHRRSLVVIFSDMLDNSEESEELFSALQHLRHNKHEVILFHVSDKKLELEFNFENRPYTFIDMESGEEIKLNPSGVREKYLEAMSKFKNDLVLKCAQLNIELVEADIREGFDKVLMEYLIKRSKMV
ncbi:MAG: DUF58 domain-containing protein [Flavobacteriales bacterium]|nr:DUF58 domain-containing protein [Flavobacteriales bacterium]